MEVVDEDPGGIPLSALGDVQRELAKLYRQVKRGTVERELGGTLSFMLVQLGALMQDRRDNRHKQRLGVLWAEHQKSLPAGSAQREQH